VHEPAAVSSSSSGMSAAFPHLAAGQWRRTVAHRRSRQGKTFAMAPLPMYRRRAPDTGEIPGIIRLQARGAAERAGSGFRRRRNPGATAICSTSRKDGATSAPMPMADRSRTRQTDAGSLQGGGRRSRRRAHRHPHLAGDAANDISDSNPQPLFDYIVDLSAH